MVGVIYIQSNKSVAFATIGMLQVKMSIFITYTGLKLIFYMFLSQKLEAKRKAEVELSKHEHETKERKSSLLNGFGNGSGLGDVRQRMAGAVASQ